MPTPDELYELYQKQVFAYLYRLCNNQSLAEELTQETFYQALKAWSNFKGTSSVLTWLCGIAKRLYWKSLKENSRKPIPDIPINEDTDFSERLIRHDQVLEIQRHLHLLEEPYREVFTLKTFCDMNHREISDLFHKSEAWSRVTYYRARQMLINALREDETE